MRKSYRNSLSFYCFVIVSTVGLGFVIGPLTFAHGATETFGYTGAYDSSAPTFGGLYVSNFTGPTDLGSITQISAFIATGGTYAKAVIYSDDSGKPSTLLAQSDQVSVTGTSGTWIHFAIGYVGTPNTPYWLGIMFLGSGTYFFVTGKTDFAICSSADSMSGPPELFPNATVSAGNELRLYASFTAQTLQASPSTPFASFVKGFLQWVVVIGIVVAAVISAVVLRSRSRKKGAKKGSNLS